jgi:UDP-N-acetylmuramyl tripeptide synthase
MRHIASTLIGKSARWAAQKRGGGSALPGLLIEKIDPDFIKRLLQSLPLGVVIVSGTNGKTTTTKMVVALLESQGLRVFTNPSGSNFSRGVAAALIAKVDRRGNLPADIAVLELDEAHAIHFVKKIPPNYCLLLNVMRDQLDRFGEIDHTATLLQTIAMHTTNGIVVNRDDPRLSSAAFRTPLHTPVVTYGVAPSLRAQFPSDDAMRNEVKALDSSSFMSDDTCLLAIHAESNSATIEYDNHVHDISLTLKGAYNILNAVGAVALARCILGTKLDETAMFKSLEQVTPAFGRGETITVNGTTCELILVKNPSGFRLSLQSFASKSSTVMIAINDQYADGRDMSWLWDVDFERLRQSGVEVVSGMRAYDMALRLQYDLVPVHHVDTDITRGLQTALEKTSGSPLQIYCTYTAMLQIRRELGKLTRVEVIA